MDLNQVTLDARDFDEGVAFYLRLGLKLIVSERDAYARFELPIGSATLSLHLAETPQVGRGMLYFEVEDVDRTYAASRERGVVFESPPADQPWRWREARFNDPTGNKLCLYHAGLDRRFPPWRLEEPSYPLPKGAAR